MNDKDRVIPSCLSHPIFCTTKEKNLQPTKAPCFLKHPTVRYQRLFEFLEEAGRSAWGTWLRFTDNDEVKSKLLVAIFWKLVLWRF